MTINPQDSPPGFPLKPPKSPAVGAKNSLVGGHLELTTCADRSVALGSADVRLFSERERRDNP